LDSSVLLRMVLGEPGRLAEWSAIDRGVTSELAQVECLRTLDRMRARGQLTDDAVGSARKTVLQLLDALELVLLGPAVLRRAADPFPTPLGTLDALHLATALEWRAAREPALVLATHDAELALAAAACGLEVIGSRR
jgi:predicted nucleic acid-binding protein